MAYTYLQAASLARNPLTAGVFKAVVTTNELISRLPFLETTGNSHDFVREGALASAEFVSLTASSLTESSSRGDMLSAPLRLISSDLDIYNYTSNLSNPNGDPRAWQVAQKLKAGGQLIQAKMITGSNVTGFSVSNATVTPGLAVDAAVPSAGTDTTLQGPGTLRYTHVGTFWAYRAPGDLEYGDNVAIAADGSATLYSYNRSKFVTITVDVSDATANGECNIAFTSSTNEPDGLQKLCPASQTVVSTGGSGDALTFDKLDELLLEKVKIKQNRVFLMNAKLKRKYLALARTASISDRISMEFIGPDGKIGMHDFPAYGGVPILQVDDIPSNEVKTVSTLSSVYLVSLEPRVGFHGVVQAGGDMMNAALDPYDARIGGFKLYDLGQRESKPAAGIRMEWYGAFGVGSPLAVGRASELVTV
jgi:hypothetical protein